MFECTAKMSFSQKKQPKHTNAACTLSHFAGCIKSFTVRRSASITASRFIIAPPPFP